MITHAILIEAGPFCILGRGVNVRVEIRFYVFMTEGSRVLFLFVRICPSEQPARNAMSSSSGRSLPGYAYSCSDETTESIQKDTLEGLYDLFEHERWWRDQSDVLFARGYKLRPRYQPGWTPSWLGANIIPEYCEDNFSQIVRP